MGSLMTTVSQDLGLTSHSKDCISYSTVFLSLHWGLFDQREDCPLLAHQHQQQLSIPWWSPTEVLTKPTLA
uniref:Uncharacterized protein n=2 Tax=Anguilla anguilla TaxID=7936 RepID=A0A0E9REA1_ANGAN